MNPSANGWINKSLKTLEANNTLENISISAFYLSLRESGFIYGNNVVVVKNER